MDSPLRLDPSHEMTESDMNERQLAEDTGDNWRDLARALKYSQAVIDAIQKDKGNSTKECCIEVLVRWMRREGQNATVKKLAEALTTIELKSVADKLMGPLPGKPCMNIKDNDSSQIDKLQKTISEIETNCKPLPTMCRHLKEEVLEVRARMKELEEKLSNATQRNQDVEQEGFRMRARIEQLEKQLQDADKGKYDAEQENLDNDLDTEQATIERRIDIRLNKLREQLNSNVTEVKEDNLKTLKKLSVSIQEIYNEIQAMVAEACKCNEDLKTDFCDFAYHGLKAEHNDLVYRVNDLELARGEMSDEEKKNFKKLQESQINRQRQVEKLEKLLRGLFCLPESLPEKTYSAPCWRSDNTSVSKKESRRRCTDPGHGQKQIKPLEQATSSGTSNDEKFGVSLTKRSKWTSIKNTLKRKENNDNMCDLLSYIRRDS